MAIHTPHQLQHGGVSPHSQSSHTHSTQPSHEVAGHAAHNASGTTPNTETKFLPLHVFNHYVLNLMGNNVPRKTSLQERRERSKQAGPERTRRGGEIPAHDAVVPVAGRARNAGVSLTLNLMRDPSGDEQHGRVDSERKARKQNLKLRPHLYIKNAENGDQTGLLPEDAGRVPQFEGQHEPGKATYDPLKLREAFKELFPTWGELRQAMQNPERVSETIEATPEKLEKLKKVMPRELRNGSVRVHTTINGVVPNLTALDVMNFFIRLGGPEICEAAMAEGRRLLKPEY